MLGIRAPGKHPRLMFPVSPRRLAIDDSMAQSRDISAARSVAFDLLRGVTAKRRTLDRMMTAHSGFRLLPARDRNFARLIAATTLRRTGQIDMVLDRCLARPLPRSAASVRDILRMAAAEMLFLGIAAHASVNSAVDLVRSRQLDRYSALVNAVLRRISRDGRSLLEGVPEACNFPDWMLAGWRAAWGAETAERLLTAALTPPPLDITVKADPSRWARELEAVRLPTGTLRRAHGGPIPDLPGYADGAWWVQDAAAALPVRLLGAVSGRSVADLCAAPGGKTAQLIAAGARVTAVDRSRSRLARLRRNLARLQLRARPVQADATRWRPDRPFDGVLVDAPCLATGTIRRHPDSLHLRRPDELPGLVAVQDQLLSAAVDMVRPGGRLVYCTCSLQREEGAERIEALLGRDHRIRREPVNAAEIGGLEAAVTDAGDMQTLPFHLAEAGGMDGFFAARLRRVS